MLVAPARRWTLIARLRRLAITWAAFPVRTCALSSPCVTSRSQWTRFSMPQCPRTYEASLAGLAFSAGNEVTTKTCSRILSPVVLSCRSLVRRIVCFAGGKPIHSCAVCVLACQVVVRPCLFSRQTYSTGRVAQGWELIGTAEGLVHSVPYAARTKVLSIMVSNSTGVSLQSRRCRRRRRR